MPGADHATQRNLLSCGQRLAEPCIRFTGLAQIAKYTYYSLSERRMAPQPPANSQGLTLPKQPMKERNIVRKTIAPMRSAWLLTAMLLLALLVQACAAPAAPAAAPAGESAAAAPAAGEPVKNALGKEMPADAAPLDQQVLVFPYAGWKNFTTVDFFQNVYDRADALTDLLSDSLMRLDKNFKVNPAAATEWSVDDSGLVWTFKLDPNLMWNDGTPVTADDYVATFQYGADPNMPGTSTGTTRA